MIGSIKDNRFRIEVMPLDKDISADWFISRPVDLLVVDVCTDPEIGLSLMHSLRLAGARTEMVAYIAPVSYTHLDVYKRQCTAFPRGA